MHRHPSGLTVLLASLAMLVLAGCEPSTQSGVTARLLTDGTGVLHNGRRAVSGARLRSGDQVLTSQGGAALVEFSDGTTVQIVEAEQPVRLSWTGNTLDIRMSGTMVEYVSGAVFDFVKMITDLASVFNESHFIAVKDRDGTYRHLLLAGHAEMIFPRPGLPIAPGQYALVSPAGEVVVRPIPAALERELRRRLDRWRFRAPKPPPGLPPLGPSDIRVPDRVFVPPVDAPRLDDVFRGGSLGGTAVPF